MSESALGVSVAETRQKAGASWYGFGAAPRPPRPAPASCPRPAGATNAPGASSRKNGTWYISSPEFVKKEAQTFFWKTRIKVEAKAYKFETTKTALGLGDLTKPSNASQTGALSLAVLGTTLLGSGSQKIEVATGSTKLDIHWSVRVDTKKRLSNAQIQDIEHLDTTWGQD